MAKPTINTVHLYGDKLRIGQGNKINKGNGDPVMTMGYIKGANICSLATGHWNFDVYRVEVKSTSGKKVWVGRITHSPTAQDDCWAFAVVNTKNDSDPTTDDTTCTVTVTNPTLPAGEQSGTSPPQTVPLDQIP